MEKCWTVKQRGGKYGGPCCIKVGVTAHDPRFFECDGKVVLREAASQRWKNYNAYQVLRRLGLPGIRQIVELEASLPKLFSFNGFSTEDEEHRVRGHAEVVAVMSKKLSGPAVLLGHTTPELVLSQSHMTAHHKFLVIIFSLCLTLWTCEASTVKSGSPGTIDTSGNTTPSAEDDGAVVQSPENSENPTEMQSPGGFDSGSTTEVDTDNETPATSQASQYEYIGPFALFTKLVGQATDATMAALTKEAAMDRKHERLRGCTMFDYL
ncbi:hypothetical protein EDD85DRAFT_797721 [Armillaria nabsnona]|nr:hypothetical protein EDD85DRAFT_797721 [Armillaria nabsnona]